TLFRSHLLPQIAALREFCGSGSKLNCSSYRQTRIANNVVGACHEKSSLFWARIEDRLRISVCGLFLATALAGNGIARASGNHVSPTATPIRHVVVIFGENISFDHYFGAYPHALNLSGEPVFHAKPNTPTVNGLTSTLLEHNPNFLNRSVNGEDATNPFRLSRAQAATADEDHDYTAEQRAFHSGLMDSFPRYTGIPGSPKVRKRLGSESTVAPEQYAHPTKGLVMGYYDGNTVTALWNYAQRYAMNDNSFGTTFGPSTIGAINLISGQT